MKKRALDSEGNQDEINEPFPLLGLPYELLEEIATWFTQQEAVKVLTVNKACHEAFSRTVWRAVDYHEPLLDLYGIVLDHRESLFELPADTWERYGPLVRVANFGQSWSLNKCIGVWIPNVQRLTINTCSDFDGVLNDEMCQLQKLCIGVNFSSMYGRIDYILSGQAGKHVLTWVKKAQDRGQNVMIEWDFIDMGTVEWDFLVKVVNVVSDVSRHSVSVSAQSSFIIDEPSLPTKLIQMLVKFDIHQIRHPGVYCDMHSGLFAGGSDGTKSSFPRLKILNLAPRLYLDDDTYDLVDLTPNKFPSLCKLAFIIDGRFTGDDNKMAGFYSHTWWNVTDLLISYQSRAEVMNRILAVFPNTKRFWINGNCIYTTDLQVITQHLPHLEDLHLVDVVGFSYGNDAEETEFHQISGIKRLVHMMHGYIDPIPLSYSFLRFIINGAPALETLKLSTCFFRKGVLEQFEGKVNKSVRTLVARIGYDKKSIYTKMTDNQLPIFVTMLPNLEKLVLVEGDESQHNAWQECFPDIKVESVREDIDFYYSDTPHCF